MREKGKTSDTDWTGSHRPISSGPELRLLSPTNPISREQVLRANDKRTDATVNG